MAERRPRGMERRHCSRRAGVNQSSSQVLWQERCHEHPVRQRPTTDPRLRAQVHASTWARGSRVRICRAQSTCVRRHECSRPDPRAGSVTNSKAEVGRRDLPIQAAILHATVSRRSSYCVKDKSAPSPHPRFSPEPRSTHASRITITISRITHWTVDGHQTGTHASIACGCS